MRFEGEGERQRHLAPPVPPGEAYRLPQRQFQAGRLVIYPNHAHT
jgi:hypothetical protein